MLCFDHLILFSIAESDGKWKTSFQFLLMISIWKQILDIHVQLNSHHSVITLFRYELSLYNRDRQLVCGEPLV